MTTAVRPCGGVSHARMGGTSRPPRCRGGRQVLPYPIDRRLRLCARVGTQHLFAVVRRRSCVVSGGGGAATGGGAGRAGAVVPLSPVPVREVLWVKCKHNAPCNTTSQLAIRVCRCCPWFALWSEVAFFRAQSACHNKPATTTTSYNQLKPANTS